MIGIKKLIRTWCPFQTWIPYLWCCLIPRVLVMYSLTFSKQIRGPPVVQRTQNGIAYIHRSSQGQLVIETYIVFLLSKFSHCQVNLLLQILILKNYARVLKFVWRIFYRRRDHNWYDFANWSWKGKRRH